MARPIRRLHGKLDVVKELRRRSRSTSIGVRDRERAEIILLRLDGVGGDRSDLSQAEHKQTGAGAQDLPLSAAQDASGPAHRIRALTGRRQIRPISTGCRRSRQPEPGRHSTYQTGKSVQTNQATSMVALFRGPSFDALRMRML
jgi:hypothetical protein